jgi:hypothetical protein
MEWFSIDMTSASITASACWAVACFLGTQGNFVLWQQHCSFDRAGHDVSNAVAMSGGGLA